MKKFPFDHILKYDTQEVWVKSDSSISDITTMRLSTLVNYYYPGYKPRIADEHYLQFLKNQLVN